ncbi:hypothetical protein [Piscinibacter sakaiensis]
MAAYAAIAGHFSHDGMLRQARKSRLPGVRSRAAAVRPPTPQSPGG